MHVSQLNLPQGNKQIKRGKKKNEQNNNIISNLIECLLLIVARENKQYTLLASFLVSIDADPTVGSADQWRQREFKVGGTSLVSRLSACLTEANWWRLIAE